MKHICKKNKCELNLFDMKKICVISLSLLAAVLGITFLRDVRIARWAVILIVCIFAVVKRKTILRTYKIMKNKDDK